MLIGYHQFHIKQIIPHDYSFVLRFVLFVAIRSYQLALELPFFQLGQSRIHEFIKWNDIYSEIPFQPLHLHSAGSHLSDSNFCTLIVAM